MKTFLTMTRLAFVLACWSLGAAGCRQRQLGDSAPLIEHEPPADVADPAPPPTPLGIETDRADHSEATREQGVDASRPTGAPVAESEPAVAPAPISEPIAAGARIYGEGILPSGRPVKAIAAGDVAFAGTLFNCASCHQRSGMGSLEGDVVAPMITAGALYRDKTTAPRRPAYTDESLANAIRAGVDPTGRRLSALMPRYEVSDADMRALVAYLKELSAEVSPGVTGEEIHFATVVTDGVNAEPMLTVLESFFRNKNNELRNPRGRRQRGAFFRRNVDLAYRKWRLHQWKLTGPSETWREQLEEHLREQPVFALVSGMSSGSWEPIHEFCEEHEIPALLPNTDLPVISDADYHTVYFSAGLFLEADVVAVDCSRVVPEGSVLQVYRDEAALRGVASNLREAAAERQLTVVSDLALSVDDEVTPERIAEKLEEAEASALVLWLERTEIEKLAPFLGRLQREVRIYLSSSLLGGQLAAVPESLRGRCVVAHPFTVEADFESRFRRVRVWLAREGKAVSDVRIMAQTYFACMLLGEVLMHVRFDYFYRNYFLETIDHTTSRLVGFCASHPALSFGPGQRYLSKGCHIVVPDGGGDGRPSVQWIVP